MRKNLLFILTLGILGLFCSQSFGQGAQSCPPPCQKPFNRSKQAQMWERFNSCRGDTPPAPMSYDTSTSACYLAYLAEYAASEENAFLSLWDTLYVGTPTICDDQAQCYGGHWDYNGGERVWIIDSEPTAYNIYCSDCYLYVFSSSISDATICARVNFYDRLALTHYLQCLNPGNLPYPIICTLVDFNQDGGIDGDDVSLFMAEYAEGLDTADVNGDGGVDGADIEIFMETWENGGCD